MDPNTSRNIKKGIFPSLIDDFQKFKEVSIRFPVEQDEFIEKAIIYARNFSRFCILRNNYPTSHNSRGTLIALGVQDELKYDPDISAFDGLQQFVDGNPSSWKFGFLGYDLKNSIEDIYSKNPDYIGFPEMNFFVPEILFYVENNSAYIQGDFDSLNDLVMRIEQLKIPDLTNRIVPDIVQFEKSPSDIDYKEIIENLRNEIAFGNIYEVNFCRQLLSKARINPFNTNLALNRYSPSPFSAFYRLEGKYLICASPERFLLKSGATLLSQPIKGTKPRSPIAEMDERNKLELRSSTKERAENVMIVDLVRNDLSRCSKKGSVRVPELFGVYTFPHVHQMISSITAELDDGINPITAIKHAFPMGSMTGAPKLRAMKLIEKYELFKRGIFSGSVGFVTPSGNFDFNVVIRSILYNEKQEIVTVPTGSAITYGCSAQQELEECELKADALMRCLHFDRND